MQIKYFVQCLVASKYHTNSYSHNHYYYDFYFHAFAMCVCVCVCMCVCVSHSVVSDSVAPQTVAWHTPLSMGFSRQEYWSELPFPSAGDLPDSGVKLRSPALQADSLLTELPGKPKTACGIQFPDHRLNPGPLHWDCEVSSATGPPGKPLFVLLHHNSPA